MSKSWGGNNPQQDDIGRDATRGFLAGFSGCLGVAFAILLTFVLFIVGCSVLASFHH